MAGKKHTDTLCSPFYTLHTIFYVLLYLTFIAIASNGFTQERIIDYVIAVVNDQPITLRELETEPIFLIVNLVKDQPITLRDLENELTSEKIKNPPNTVKRAALEALIERKLMLQKADDIGILLGSWGQRVDAAIQTLQYGYTDEARFSEDLRRIGLEYQELEEWLRNDLIVKELVIRQFRNSINSKEIDQAAPQYFERHRSEFIQSAQIQFQYILVRSKPDDAADLQAEAEAFARRISSQLKTGIPFQEIQRAYPNHPLLRVVTEPQTVPTETKIRLTIARLAVNEVSQPISIPEGYLIAKLLKKEPARQQTYPEVSEKIKNKLITDALQTQSKKWLVKQKAVADLRILDPELAKTSLPRTTTGN